MQLPLDFPFTKANVEVTINQMSSFKSRDPDGFSASFYKDNWD